MTHAVVRPVQAARFLCRAAWRCAACDTPWMARETIPMAFQTAREHDEEVHGEER